MESLRLHRGYTLIELLVVLSIIIIVSSIVVTSHSTFNKTLILGNAAYDIALTLRTAETFGIGSRTSGASLNTGYGLHFDVNVPDSFILFADTLPPVGSPASSLCHTPPANDPTGPDAKPGNCVYDGTAEWHTEYALNNGITINRFCAYVNSWSCSPSLTSLDIVFSRPNPDAFISKDNSYAAPPSSVTKACVSVTSPQGGERYVSVTASGQIIPNARCCDTTCP